jgi:hypothetical protein
MKMFPRWIAVLLCVCAGALIPEAIAQDVNAIELLRTKPTADGGQAYSLTLQALGLMTFLTLLPAIVLSMTAFTRDRHRPRTASASPRNAADSTEPSDHRTCVVHDVLRDGADID